MAIPTDEQKIMEVLEMIGIFEDECLSYKRKK